MAACVSRRYRRARKQKHRDEGAAGKPPQSINAMTTGAAAGKTRSDARQNPANGEIDQRSFIALGNGQIDQRERFQQTRRSHYPGDEDRLSPGIALARIKQAAHDAADSGQPADAE
jgi:hypothetical protein